MLHANVHMGLQCICVSTSFSITYFLPNLQQCTWTLVWCVDAFTHIFLHQRYEDVLRLIHFLFFDIVIVEQHASHYIRLHCLCRINLTCWGYDWQKTDLALMLKYHIFLECILLSRSINYQSYVILPSGLWPKLWCMHNCDVYLNQYHFILTKNMHVLIIVVKAKILCHHLFQFKLRYLFFSYLVFF